MSWEIRQGDVLERLREMPDESIQTCVTSPPYWGLRDYGVDGQLGLEATPELFIAAMVEVFAEVKRVLRDDGTLWLNIGDCYATGAGKVGEHPGGGAQGSKWAGRDRPTKQGGRNLGPMTQPNRLPQEGLKPKDLVGIPWMLAFALRADGWFLRSDIIWSKPNPMPESVTDRPTKSHEYLFLLTKSGRYYYDNEAIREQDLGNDHRRIKPSSLDAPEPTGGLMKPHKGLRIAEGRNGRGRNKRTVWPIATRPFPDAHFATFPRDLVVPCVKAGTPHETGGDVPVVLDPFSGAGTTLLVAEQLGRDSIGIELNPEYAAMATARIEAWEHNKDGKLKGDPEPVEGQLDLIGEAV